MKEKIYEITIDRALDAGRRNSINQFLDENSSKIKWPSSYHWDEANELLLYVSVFPVRWEIWFAPKEITVYGSGPLWAKMLFTQRKKAMLREGIVHVLTKTGFLNSRFVNSAPSKHKYSLAE